MQELAVAYEAQGKQLATQGTILERLLRQVERQGDVQGKHGRTLETHIKQCDESNIQAKAAAEIKTKAFEDLTRAVERITKPFENVDLDGIDGEAVVKQFRTINQIGKNADSAAKWIKRGVVSLLGLVVAAIVGAGATVYFQGLEHKDTMRAIDAGAASGYTEKQGAADKAGQDRQFKALRDQK